MAAVVDVDVLPLMMLAPLRIPPALSGCQQRSWAAVASAPGSQHHPPQSAAGAAGMVSGGSIDDMCKGHEDVDEPLSPRVSVTGVTNGVINSMLSEDGVPLVKTGSGITSGGGCDTADCAQRGTPHGVADLFPVASTWRYNFTPDVDLAA